MGKPIPDNHKLIGEYTRRLSREYRRARGITNPSDLVRKFKTATELDAFLASEQGYINEQLRVILPEEFVDDYADKN